MNQEGPFLRVEIGPESPQAIMEDVAGADEASKVALADQPREAQAQLTEAQVRNKTLAREVGELTVNPLAVKAAI